MTAATRSRPLRRCAALIALAATVALVLGLARPAGAHEGDAVLVVEGVHPAGQSIHYIVRVTWADDGHPADGATVTATAIAPDGTQLTPVALAPADNDGRYSGAIEYPTAGTWTVRITSIDPTGTIEQPQEVTATATTASPDDTTGSGDAGGFAPADDGTGDSDEGEGDRDEQAAGDGGDSGMPLVVIVVAALVVVGGAVAALRLIRRTRGGPPAGAAGGGPAPEPPASAATAPGAAIAPGAGTPGDDPVPP